MRAKKFSGLTLVCLPFLACSASNNTNVDAHIKLIDGGKLDSGSGSAACTATASYGAVTFGSADQAEINYAANLFGSGSPHEEEVQGPLNQDTTPDFFDLQLYDGFGGFGSGAVRPGTYTISGDDLQFSTCGICALVDTNVSTTTGDFVDQYLATGGTVTITSAGTNGSGTLSGSVANLTFVHVSIGSDDTSTPITDGCSSSITSAAFSGPLMVGSAGFTGKPTSLHHRFH